MWTHENRPKYNRDHLRYPSDLTDDEQGTMRTSYVIGAWLRSLNNSSKTRSAPQACADVNAKRRFASESNGFDPGLYPRS